MACDIQQQTAIYSRHTCSICTISYACATEYARKSSTRCAFDMMLRETANQGKAITHSTKKISHLHRKPPSPNSNGRVSGKQQVESSYAALASAQSRLVMPIWCHSLLPLGSLAIVTLWLFIAKLTLYDSRNKWTWLSGLAFLFQSRFRPKKSSPWPH